MKVVDVNVSFHLPFNLTPFEQLQLEIWSKYCTWIMLCFRGISTPFL